MAWVRIGSERAEGMVRLINAVARRLRRAAIMATCHRKPVYRLRRRSILRETY